MSGTCICPAGYYGSQCGYHHTCMVLSYLCNPCCSFHHKHIETYCYGQTLSHSFLFILYCLLHRDWHLFIVLIDYIYVSSFRSSVHLPFSTFQATPLVKMVAHVVVIIPAHALQVTTETSASTGHVSVVICKAYCVVLECVFVSVHCHIVTTMNGDWVLIGVKHFRLCVCVCVCVCVRCVYVDIHGGACVGSV